MQLTDKLPALQADLARASREHFRLVWLAGGTDSDRSALLRALAEAEDGIFVDLGKKLSEAMIQVPAALRTASVAECFDACLGNSPSIVTCLNHLEILFDPSLRINPVTLVKRASRHALIVAAWPGLTKDGQLTFGCPDHPTYMETSKQDLESLVHIL